MPSKVFKIQRGENVTKIHFKKDKSVVEICKLASTPAVSFINIGDEIQVEGKDVLWTPKEKGVKLKQHPFRLLGTERVTEFVEASTILCHECFLGVCSAIEELCKDDHPDFYAAALKSATARLYVDLGDKMFELRVSKEMKIAYPFKALMVLDIVDKHLVSEDD